LSFVGIATSLGLPVEIPIIIRSLADCMALVNPDLLPLTFEASFKDTLDIGAHNNDNKSKVVDKYELSWWSGRKPRNIDNVEVLKGSTLQKCLDHYKQQLSISTAGARVAPAETGARLNTWDKASPDAGSSADAGPSPNAGPSLNCSGDLLPCQNCTKYRQLLSDVLLDTLKFRDRISAMSTTSSNLLDRGIRRASAFNLLHEAALLKETAGVPPPAPSSKKIKITRVKQTASSELDRLKKLPASSYKWTWGVNLTEEDVLALRRSGTCPGRGPHSGYDISLRSGKNQGIDSTVRSIHTSLGPHEDLPADVPPPTPLSFPPYFSRDDHRISYDPHCLSTSTSDPAPAPALLPTTQGDTGPEMPSTGTAHPLQLADIWCDDDGDGSTGEEVMDAVHIPALSLAEAWKECDEQDDEEDDEKELAPADKIPSPGKAQPLQLAEVWCDVDDDGPSGEELIHMAQASALLLAENWMDCDEPVEESTHFTEPVPAPVILPQVDVLLLADNWRDDNGSGDLTGDETLAPAPASVMQLAEEWRDFDDNEELSPAPALSAGNPDVTEVSTLPRSYGPEDFRFLDEMSDEMSDDDSSDEGAN
jgi:hypothetical protein